VNASGRGVVAYIVGRDDLDFYLVGSIACGAAFSLRSLRYCRAYATRACAGRMLASVAKYGRHALRRANKILRGTCTAH